MMAFCGVAIAGKSDFTALAPGVAGALLTTVAGLVVAVPSLVGYNFINGKIKEVTVTMDNFVGEFMARLRLEQVELSRRAKERQ
jgi:biopolymer transport protein ExbB/TolQ